MLNSEPKGYEPSLNQICAASDYVDSVSSRDTCVNCGFLRPRFAEPDGTLVCLDCYGDRSD
jgi:hypothetical protein